MMRGEKKKRKRKRLQCTYSCHVMLVFKHLYYTFMNKTDNGYISRAKEQITAASYTLQKQHYWGGKREEKWKATK